MLSTAKEFLPDEHVRLAEQAIEGHTTVERARIVNAVVDPRAAFDPVIAGEFVLPEQGRVVEYQALGIVIFELAGQLFVGRATICAIGSKM